MVPNEMSSFGGVKKFFAGTFLSRISGFVRDVALAYCFGAGVEIALFMVAYRMANLFRRLIGESTLHASFIPHYELLKKNDLKKAALFYRDTLFSFLIIVLMLLFILEAVRVFFHLGQETGVFSLMRLMFPSLIFMALFGISSAFLQCERRFFLPAVAPLFFNVALTIGAFVIYFFKGSVQELSLFVVLGFFVQWLFISIPSFQMVRPYISYKEWLRPMVFSPEIKKMIHPCLLSIIGIGAVQINSAIDALFAKYADALGPVYLWYSIRLAQLPMALFGVAIATAVFPALCRSVLLEDGGEFERKLVASLQRMIGIMIPATFAIFALGGVSVNLLFGRGEFSSVAVYETFHCLIVYGAGLFFLVATLIFSNAFYAKKNYFFPTIASVASVLLNLALNALFIFYFHGKAASVAYATTISAVFQTGLLFWRLQRYPIATIIIPLLRKVFFISLFSALLALLLGHYCLKDPTWAFFGNEEIEYGRSFSQQIGHFSCMTGIFFLSLFSLAKIFHVHAITQWLEFFSKKDKEKIQVM
ncbi:MAG: murein biosynthesis integral membrane protein MurJ [Parachlamydiales bacterium]|nr:murein biosynthesis integral membrane protein MurJ [Parachlamydiales bacterium]